MRQTSLIAAAGAGLLGLTGGAHLDAMPIRVDAGRMLMKATPQIEGGQRVVYFQASTESRDYQGERILARALVESIPYFIRHGRIDLDHASVEGKIRGQRVDPYAYEIGKPIDARPSDAGVMVKAYIYSSKTPGMNRWTEAADLFWDSITETQPPVLWYPSVQGLVTNELGVVADGRPTQEIRGMLWQSVGLSRTPVSPDVPAITTVALRVFAKALGNTQGMTDLLAQLRGFAPPAPAAPVVDPTDELPIGQVHQVLEALANAPAGTPPAVILRDLEARGIPQDRALAVMFGLLTSPI